jgi:hypothetical protein
MNVRKVRDELASLRKEVEERAAVPLVVGPSGYADQDAGPPVVIARWPGIIIMVDPRDLGL